MSRLMSVVFLGLLGSMVMPCSAQDTATQPGAATTTQETKPQATQADEGSTITKASYLIGYNFAKTLKTQGADVDMQQLFKGMETAMAGGEVGMENEEIESVMMAFQNMMRKAATERVAKEAEENKTKGAAYLAANEKKPGVKKLENGVQYEVMTAGAGAKPALTDKVKIHYKGMLTDGTVFDSSIGKDPAQFPVGGVIKGFTSALLEMPVGSKWKVTIPSDLAYGVKSPRGSKIGPNSVLVFEIELLEILGGE